MSYASLGFLAFLAVVTLVYYVVPKRFQWAVLLVASYAFYLTSGIKQVVFIIATTVVTFCAGLYMQKVRDNYKQKAYELADSKDILKELKAATAKKIHSIQVLSVLFNLGILAVVKYLNFGIENLNTIFALFNSSTHIEPFDLIVPLGISFYTFMSVGYLIDIGRGKYEAERHLGRFALFVSFFPSIIQGPINRYADLSAQFKKEHSFEYNNLTYGAQLILWGFFKKLVIADRIAPVVGDIFSSRYVEFPGSAVLFGMFVYAMQIYGDFSGGIDIARGAAQILGIDLPQNFERPYFSLSVAEYWRRWHITLGGWMRDYVFYPVMLSKPVTKISKHFRKKGKAKLAKLVPSVITPFVVFFLIGIWHGATFNYIAFGLYNAIIVASSVALDPLFKKTNKALHIKEDAFYFRVFRIVRTFMVLGVSKIFVRAPGFTAAGHMLKSVFVDFQPTFLWNNFDKFSIDTKNFVVFLLACLLLFVVSVLQESGVKIRDSISKKHLIIRWALFISLFVIVVVFGVYGPDYNAVDFIYQAY